MTVFIYSTESRVHGPWLLSRAELQALDGLLESEWQKLTKTRNDALASEVEKQVVQGPESMAIARAEETRAILRNTLESTPPFVVARRILLSSSEQPTVLVSSFDEALRDPALLDRVFRGFDLHWQCGPVELQLALTADRMILRTSPELNSTARELFAVLRQWQETHQPPRWQQIWKQARGWPWLILFVVFIGTNGGSPEQTVDLTPVRQKARVLLSDGLGEDEVAQALEALLRLQVGYESKAQIARGVQWQMILLVATILAAIVLSFVPKSLLGIGRGEARIRQWRMWFRFVFFSIPGFLAATFLWPYIQDFLRSVVSSEN